MPRASSEPRRGYVTLGGLLGLAGSLALHALLYGVLHLAGTLPAMDFELTLPSEVEFGVSEPAAPEPSAPAAPPAQPAASTPPSTASVAEGPKPRPRPKSEREQPDAGVASADPEPAD